MYKFSFMLKTYSGDFFYAQRLIKSFNKHNQDCLPMHIVVPARDYELFKNSFKSVNIHVLNEEKMGFDFVHDDSIRGIRPGYINQEIVKLQFWEHNLSQNYFCIDSDSEFIRDFGINDFMFDETIPYSVLVEDKELHVDPLYYKKYWIGRELLLNVIKKELGIANYKTLTCHNNTVLNANVLRDFKENFMAKRSFRYQDLMKISPYEFSWYNFWLQLSGIIEIRICEPHFKMFHTREQHEDYLNRGITLKDISRAYIGVVINSNYSRGYGLVGYEDGHLYRRPLLQRIKAKLRRIITSFLKK